jgi:hypothetical protein
MMKEGPAMFKLLLRSRKDSIDLVDLDLTMLANVAVNTAIKGNVKPAITVKIVQSTDRVAMSDPVAAAGTRFEPEPVK